MNDVTASLNPSPEILKSRTRVCHRTFFVTVLLGILGSVLFKGAAPGLNITLWIFALAAAMLFAESGTPLVMARRRNLALSPLLLLSVCFLWRDSPVLMKLDFGFIILLLLLIPWQISGNAFLRSYLATYAVKASQSFEKIVSGLLELVFKDMEWNTSGGSRWMRYLPQVLVGLLMSLPLVLLFGALFYSADLRFENLIGDLFDFEAFDAFLYVCIWLLCAWIAGGFLRASLLSETPGQEETFNSRELLGGIEMNVVLVMLNLLFASFVVIQIPYLFGGAERISAVAGLTYADYARRGFFELVSVACLLLPLLLFADWLVGANSSKRLFRLLSATLVGLLFIIMASAMHRMWMYQSTYGLTELRFYTTAFMFWLALVFVWFLVTVLRGKRNCFTFGALAVAYAFVIGLHVVNPDRWIANTNLKRAQEGMPFDAEYTASLSADAVPVLLENLGMLDADDQLTVSQAMNRFGSSEAAGDWRRWNHSRANAKRSMEINE